MQMERSWSLVLFQMLLNLFSFRWPFLYVVDVFVQMLFEFIFSIQFTRSIQTARKPIRAFDLVGYRSGKQLLWHCWICNSKVFVFLLVRFFSETLFLLAVKVCRITKKELEGKPSFSEVFKKMMKYITNITRCATKKGHETYYPGMASENVNLYVRSNKIEKYCSLISMCVFVFLPCIW